MQVTRLGLKERDLRIMREHTMESQAFLPAMYSLRTQDLIPPDDFEDADDTDVRWLEYCRMASMVPRTRFSPSSWMS